MPENPVAGWPAVVSCAEVLRALRSERSGLAEAEVPSRVADDQVIEQRDIQDVSGLREPDSQPCVVRARSRIAARMVVHDEQCGRAWGKACRDEDIWDRDRRARTCASRQDVP